MKIKHVIFRIGIAFITLFVGVSAVLIHVWQSSQQCPALVIEDSPKDNSLPIMDSDEEYEVYSSVLESLYFNEAVVVSDYTVNYSSNYGGDINRKYYDLTGDTINDFQYKNKKIYKLENKFKIAGKAFILSQEEENILFPKGGAGWDKFYQRFPKAKEIIYFSNVGFDQKKDEALVRVGYECGICGLERLGFYSLKKIKGKWVIFRVSR